MYLWEPLVVSDHIKESEVIIMGKEQENVTQATTETASNNGGNQQSQEKVGKRKKNRNSNKSNKTSSGNGGGLQKFPQMVKDAATMSFFNPLGNGMKNVASHEIYMPGICALHFIPTVGVSKDRQSPINRCADAVYAKIRKEINKIAGYDAPDLMMYILAMNSIYDAIAHLKRMYGLATYFKAENRYVPEALFEAQRIDYKLLVDQLVNFRWRINRLCKQIDQVYVPDTITFMGSQSMFYENVYMDENISKAALYICVPSCMYKYDEQVGSLIYKTFYSEGLLDPFEILETVEEAVAAVTLSQSCCNMSGDIRKAYGDAVKHIDGIDESYTVEPIYNEDFLKIVNNATVIKAPSFETRDITLDRDNNMIVYDPKFIFDANQPDITGTFAVAFPYTKDKIINASSDNPSPDEVSDMTEWTAAMYEDSSHTTPGELALKFESVGPVFINRAIIYYFTSNLDGARVLRNCAFKYSMNFNSVGNDTLMSALLLEKFAKHPPVQYVTSSELQTLHFSGDISNYRPISTSDLQRIQETHLMDLMNTIQ